MKAAAILVSCALMSPATAMAKAACHADSDNFAISGTVRLGKGQKGESPADGYYQYAYLSLDRPICVKTLNYPSGVMIKRARIAADPSSFMPKVGQHVSLVGELGDASNGNDPEQYDLLPKS